MIMAKSLAETGKSLLNGVEIPYRLGGHTTWGGMDCQGLIRYCYDSNGGKAGWIDSNGLARNCIQGELLPLAQAQRQSDWMAGWVLFIIDKVSSSTPMRYKSDAFAFKFGDCSHVGLYINDGDNWSVDASASAGKVRGRTKRDAPYVWTHAAKLKGVTYAASVQDSTSSEQDSTSSEVVQDEVKQGESGFIDAPHKAYVNTIGGGKLNLRSSPTTDIDNRRGSAPDGAELIVLSQNGKWSKVVYKGLTAYAQSMFLVNEGVS